MDRTITPTTPQTCSESAMAETRKPANKDAAVIAKSKTFVNPEDQCKDVENPTGNIENQSF